MVSEEHRETRHPNVEQKDTLYSWFIAFWLFIVNCIDDGISKAFGVALIPLSDEYDVKVWIVGSTVSVMIFVGSAIALLVTPASKFFSSRQLMMASGLITSLGLILVWFPSNWTLFSILSVLLTGPGTRCATVLIFSCIQIYFEKDFALASAFLSSGRPIGTMVFAPLTQVLLDNYGGRGSLLILGAASFHIVLVGALLKPSDNTYQIIENENDSKSDNGKGPLSSILNLFEIKTISNPKFLTLSVGVLGTVYAFQTWMIYIVPHGISKGLTPYQAISLSSSGCVGQLVGLGISGLVIDKEYLHESKVRFLSLLCMGASFAIDPWCTSFVSLLLLSFLCGLGIAMFFPAQMKAVKSIGKDRNTPGAYSYIFFVAAMGRLIGGVISGWFYDQTGSYDQSFLIIAGVEFAAAIIVGIEILLYRETRELKS